MPSSRLEINNGQKKQENVSQCYDQYTRAKKKEKVLLENVASYNNNNNYSSSFSDRFFI